MNLEPRIIFLLIIALLLVCVLSTSTEDNCNSKTQNKNENESTSISDKNPDIKIENGVYIIEIDAKTFEKMVDIVTNYSLMTNDHDKKLILIYLSTFHLFDMNYGYNAVKRVDDRLSSYPYVPNHIEYPVGNMHNNIQKAIITHITHQIDKSERQFLNEFSADRKIIDIYLSTLFKSIGIMH
jgi:hypothetical protein